MPTSPGKLLYREGHPRGWGGTEGLQEPDNGH